MGPPYSPVGAAHRLPVLVAGELLRPRLAYDVRRWSTVFPIAICAVCSFAVGKATAAPAITDFGAYGRGRGWRYGSSSALRRFEAVRGR